ncbi:hypothetical protein [Streptomyces sp. NPDC006463]
MVLLFACLVAAWVAFTAHVEDPEVRYPEHRCYRPGTALEC